MVVDASSMADSDSDGEGYRRSEVGRSREHIEIEELSDAAERFLEEQEERGTEATYDEEEEDEEYEDVDYIPVEDSLVRDEIGNTASTSAPARLGQEEGVNKRRRQWGGEAVGSSSGCVASQGSEWNLSEIDGLFCPICMEPWTNDGDHHIWYVNPLFRNRRLPRFDALTSNASRS